MEKGTKDFGSEELFAPKFDRRRSWRGNVGVVVGLLTLLLLLLTPSPLSDVKISFFRTSRAQNTEAGIKSKDAFSWSQITPSKELEYTPCFEDFLCARLDVPLNWNASDRDGGPRAAIAIVKVPARVPVTDPRYSGSVLMNPGGPGESGVHQVLSAGKHVQVILDSPISPEEPSEGKYFDIIGFDPRGVNNTTPRLRCFPDAFNQQYWLLKFPDYSFLWDYESVLGMEWARAEAMGASCQREGDENDMARYANTAQTANDMLEFVERHGEWREKMASVIMAKDAVPTAEQKAIVERTAWKKGQEKIQYWGISYGTLLGQTFAAMHPDRILRLVIDGVVDPDDHYSGTWLTQLQDSDSIVTKFCEYCFEAGPEKCPLWTGKSGRDVEARLEKIMDDLKLNPIAVATVGHYGPEVVTWGDMLLHLLTGMFFPYSSSEFFFTMLAELEVGNGTRVGSMKQSFLRAAEIPAECIRDGPFSDACVTSHYISGMGSFQDISCMDIAGRNNITKRDFHEYTMVLRNQSKWLYTSWARNKLACLGYTIAPAWTFEGPIAGNTSHPLLIIGNTHDTVTPLRNARRVSTLFPGSAVLHQDSQGHCSYSNPSLCTGKTVREYFQTGKLPEAGKICSTEWLPFIGCVNKDANGDCVELSLNDQILWDAMVGVTEVRP